MAQGARLATSFRDERGFALPLLLLLFAIGALVLGSNLYLMSGTIRTQHAFNLRTKRYYTVESAMNKAAAWLRDNSDEMVSLFGRDSFYNSLDRSAFSIGTNDLNFPVATKVKLLGSNFSVLLTSHSSLGLSNFPNTQNLSGATFYPAVEFGSIDFGDVLVRVTLVDGVPVDPLKDFGAPPNPTPQTDFAPVFRIDAMSKIDSGTHMFGYFLGSLKTATPKGFYGEDLVDIGQDCDSYDATSGGYSLAVRAANCPVSSRGPVCIRNTADVYGSVDTTGTVTTGGACQGTICSDTSCASTAAPCEGAGCSVSELPEFETWETYCPAGSEAAAIVVAPGTEHQLAAAASGPNCFSAITVPPTGTLVLTSTSKPYFIRSLDLGKLEIRPDSAGGTVTVFAQTVVSGAINGTSIINSANRPSQFVFNYLGATELKLNGNAEFSMFVTAPYAEVEVLGNSDFYGGIAAKSLKLNGNADVHYDESPVDDSPQDVHYRLTQISQVLH